MNYPIVFESLTSPIFGANGLSFIFALLSIAGIVFFTINRSIQVTYRNLGSLLCFFGFMMSAGSAWFGYVFGERIGNVEVYENRFETAYGTVNYDEVKNIIIKKENRKSTMIQPQLSGDYSERMIILTKELKEYTFSEGNYPIRKMMKPMRTAWEASNKKGSIE